MGRLSLMGYADRRDAQFDPASECETPDDKSVRVAHDQFTAPASRRKRLNGLAVRRVIGVGALAGMALGLYWIVFRTDLLTPVLAYVGPTRDLIAWVAADPMRAWGALAVLLIPHIGLYYLLFDDRNR